MIEPTGKKIWERSRWWLIWGLIKYYHREHGFRTWGLFHANMPAGYLGFWKIVCAVVSSSMASYNHYSGGAGETLEEAQYYDCTVTCLQYLVIRTTFITICLTHSKRCCLLTQRGKCAFFEKICILSKHRNRTNLLLSVFQCRGIKERKRHNESQATRGVEQLRLYTVNCIVISHSPLLWHFLQHTWVIHSKCKIKTVK